MIEGRNTSEGAENSAFTAIDHLATDIHGQGKSSTAKYGEYVVSVPGDKGPGRLFLNVKASDLPESPERYSISRSTRNVKERVSDDMLIDPEGTFRYRDSAQVIDTIRKYTKEDPEGIITDEHKAEVEGMTQDRLTQSELGLDAATDRSVHKYLAETKDALGDRWPGDISLPEESAGDVSPTPATYDLFGSVADRLARDKEYKIDQWSDKNSRYRFSTDLNNNSVEKHVLSLSEDGGEERGLPIIRSTEWGFPRSASPSYLTFTSINYDEVSYDDLDPEAQETYDEMDANTAEFMGALGEVEMPEALPVHIETAKVILERRKDALAAENDN